MVQIPRAESQRNITTQTTAPRVQDIGSFTRTSRALAEAGGVVLQIDADFKRLRTLREVTKGTIEANRRMTELESETLNDPNLSEGSLEGFNQQTQEIVNEVLGSVGDEQSRLQLQLQLEGSRIAKGFNIKRHGRNADIANAEVETGALEQQAALDIFKDDGSQSAMIRGNLIAHYNRQLAIGYQTKKQIAGRIAAFDEKVRKGKPQFEMDMLINQFGSDGVDIFVNRVRQEKAYPGLTTQEEDGFVKDALSRKDRELKIEKLKKDEAQSENLTALLPKIKDINSGLSESQLDIMVLEGTLSSTDADRAKKVLKSKKGVDATTDPLVLNKIRNMQSGVRKKDDGSRFSRLELQREVLANIENLDETTVKQLINDISKDEDVFNKDIKVNASFKIKTYANEFILTDVEAKISGKAKAQAMDLETKFHQRVLAEEATGQRLYEIADEIIDNDRKERDPNYDPSEFKDKSRIKVLPKNQTAINISTGEVIQLIGGQWVPITPKQTNNTQ